MPTATRCILAARPFRIRVTAYNRKGCPRRIYQLSQYLACPWNIPTKVGYLHVKAGYSYVKTNIQAYRHIGIYAYRVGFLKQYA